MGNNYSNYPMIDCYGTKYRVGFSVSQYRRPKNTAIEMICVDEENYGEPFGTLTVNLDLACLPDEGFVDVNNNPAAEQMIEKYGLGKPTGRIRQSGYVVYPQYKFDMERIEKYMV